MLEFKLYQVGSCSHCQRMTLSNGSYQKVNYPSLCALIKHQKHGYLLYDTGYSDQFFDETQKFPYSLYKKITPVTLNLSLAEQLMQDGIDPCEIKHIIISHFHSDHISGLNDFPNAKFIVHQDALDSIKKLSKLRALSKGFLPNLLPSDFYNRIITLNNIVELPKDMKPFESGYSLFDDQSLVIVELFGHASGHIGLLVNTKQPIFLIGDSCWHSETFKNLIMPSCITQLITEDKKAYIKTIHQLNKLHKGNKDLLIVPSHCDTIAKDFVGKDLC